MGWYPNPCAEAREPWYTSALKMSEPRLITLPSFCDQRGTLAVAEWPGTLPFTPKRFYYLYNLLPDALRGVHAHWKEEEVILALSGSFTVTLDDGCKRTEHRLDRPEIGLHIPSLIWHELHGFSTGAVCAVFASEERCDQEDYCRDYQQFLQARKARSKPRALP